VKFDLAEPDFSQVPKDADYVLNFAVSYDFDFDKAITTIVEGLGFLMSHCRDTKAFLHCSTTGVYQFKDHTPIKETDPLGDSHKDLVPPYSICKIAAEGVARFAAKHWNIPTTIARLNVPYGDNFGWPSLHMEMILAGQPITVHANKPSIYSPINQDDIIGTIPKLLDIASVPATIVNWAGKDQVSVEDWCELIGQLVKKDVRFEYTDHTLESIIADTTKMKELVGETQTDWREGIRRMVQTMHPELG
jgi:nucleoside-diphosphate-sugar epimerase